MFIKYAMKQDILPIVKLNHVAGFTLIEVLVSMLILAVGLLGIASLQFKGLKYSTDAAIRSNITMLAYNMAERMRVDRNNAGDYVSTYTVPTSQPTQCRQKQTTSTDNLDCWRKSFWTSNTSSHIPPATTVTIAQVVDSPGMYLITFGWTDTESGLHTIGYPFKP